MSGTKDKVEDLKPNKEEHQENMDDNSALTDVQQEDAESLEENLSSEEWTIIDKKDESDDNDDKTHEGPKETVVKEDACDSKETIKTEAELVEEGEEAGEKEPESDDVSILSDESEGEEDGEGEQVTFEDGRIQRIEWRFDRRGSDENALVPSDSDGNVSANALITCSVVALILGIIIASQIVEFRGEKTSYMMNADVEAKLKELSGIEERLKELKEVKQALDQIKISMPEMKLLKDQLANQKKEKYKPKQSIDDLKNLENIENILNLNAYDDKLDILEATYQNFCSTVNKLNSTNLIIDSESCKTPKVLADMIIFKKSLRYAFDKTHQRNSPEKRMFVDIERKLDAVSDSLLSDMSIMFSRFSLKIQDRFSKFAYKLQERICMLNNNGKADDEFLNILLNNEYFLNNCNEKPEPFITNNKFNSSWKEDSKKKNRFYEEERKNNNNYHENTQKNYNDHKNSRDSHSFEKERGDHSNANSRGEVKNDNNWKEDRYNYEKSFDEDVYDKSYGKNNNQYNGKSDADNNNSFENYKKTGSQHESENKKEFNQELKIDKNKDSGENHHAPQPQYKNNENNYKYNDLKQDYERKYDSYKKDNNYNREEKNEYRKEWDHDKYERTKDYDFDRKYEHNIYHPDFDPTFEKYVKNDYYYKKENKRDRAADRDYKNNKKVYEYDNNDEKFVMKDEDRYTKQKYKYEKEYVKPDDFKESKYVKNHAGDRKDKQEKYRVDGEWQMYRFTKEEPTSLELSGAERGGGGREGL